MSSPPQWRRPRAAAAAAAMLVLAACSRPLAPGEAAFAADLFGDGIDLAAVRVTEGAGLGPLPARPAPPVPAAADPGPDPCRRAPAPGRGPPAAFVIGNRIHLVGRFYRDDMLAGWPGPVHPVLALLLAHELVHVWQWQRRAVTGFSPLAAMAEGLGGGDPYFHAADSGRAFLAHGYEQQAAIVEDYVCHLLLDPGSPRLERLAAILAPHLALARIGAASISARIRSDAP
ncbi:MAG: hypothetical protein KJZ85_08275 [Rhodobacteraceae bacterium]|nr:hypothetical protein [Paracoccaceae bacterium]